MSSILLFLCLQLWSKVYLSMQMSKGRVCIRLPMRPAAKLMIIHFQIRILDSRNESLLIIMNIYDEVNFIF